MYVCGKTRLGGVVRRDGVERAFVALVARDVLSDEEREDVDKAGLGERCDSVRKRSDPLQRRAFPLEPVVDR